MYRIIAGLVAVLSIIGTAVVKLQEIEPVPFSNTVLAEKSDNTNIGGQFAIVVPKDLDDSQHALLREAYDIAKADGHKNPELLQGIILQETKAGSMKSYKVAGTPGDQYYGVSQIKVGATREVMASWPALWAKFKFHTHTDDELKANLILNNQFNMQIASKYLMLLHTKYGYSGQQLVNAYNKGPGGVQSVGADFEYGVAVRQKLAAMKLK